MESTLTAAMVGSPVIVVFTYSNTDDEDTVDALDELATLTDSEPIIQQRVPEEWSARVACVRSLTANPNSNALEVSFWYNDDEVLFSGPDMPQPSLSPYITVPNCSYYLYTVPPSMNHLVPVIDTSIPDDFLSELDSAGHHLLAPFSDYASLRAHLSAGDKDFMVVHKHYSGWAAYDAKLVDVDDCLGADLPLFIFEYDNSGENPRFCTDESQLPDEQLPAMRIGPSMTYFLFSA